VILNCVGRTILNLVDVSVPGRTILILSQLIGKSLEGLRVLDPRMKVHVTAILDAQIYGLYVSRVEKRLVHFYWAKIEMILLWFDWIIF